MEGFSQGWGACLWEEEEEEVDVAGWAVREAAEWEEEAAAESCTAMGLGGTIMVTFLTTKDMATEDMATAEVDIQMSPFLY